MTSNVKKQHPKVKAAPEGMHVFYTVWAKPPGQVCITSMIN